MTVPTAYATRHIQSETSATDRELLFEAVVWRLRILASEAPAASVRATIEDCAQALEQLHACGVPQPNDGTHLRLSEVLTVAHPMNGHATHPARRNARAALH